MKIVFLLIEMFALIGTMAAWSIPALFSRINDRIAIDDDVVDHYNDGSTDDINDNINNSNNNNNNNNNYDNNECHLWQYEWEKLVFALNMSNVITFYSF